MGGGGLITDEDMYFGASCDHNEASADFKFSTEGNCAVELPAGLAAANDQFGFPARSSVR